MAEIELKKTPTGEVPVCGPCRDGDSARASLRVKLQRAKKLQGQSLALQKKVLDAVKAGDVEKAQALAEDLELSRRRGIDGLEAEIELLEGDLYEIRCPKSGVVVIGTSEEQVKNDWNKAVTKHEEDVCPHAELDESKESLAQCRKDGIFQEKNGLLSMVILRCSECHVRCLPFPPEVRRGRDRDEEEQ